MKRNQPAQPNERSSGRHRPSTRSLHFSFVYPPQHISKEACSFYCFINIYSSKTQHYILPSYLKHDRYHQYNQTKKTAPIQNLHQNRDHRYRSSGPLLSPLTPTGRLPIHHSLRTRCTLRRTERWVWPHPHIQPIVIYSFSPREVGNIGRFGEEGLSFQGALCVSFAREGAWLLWQ